MKEAKARPISFARSLKTIQRQRKDAIASLLELDKIIAAKNVVGLNLEEQRTSINAWFDRVEDQYLSATKVVNEANEQAHAEKKAAPEAVATA